MRLWSRSAKGGTGKGCIIHTVTVVHSAVLTDIPESMLMPDGGESKAGEGREQSSVPVSMQHVLHEATMSIKPPQSRTRATKLSLKFCNANSTGYIVVPRCNR